ncbi:FKBP-type peptidyl-prolyl cis-trans isomerase SlyD [Allopseudospirillum japonicum]|uniref:Peptidyl-prolyl cis-trans isomerase n=1 Tax=Allopseudospirillum japonicum TaxID=64971 RepID=A0A1H6Q654_9GAMM|nr:peptidylprolyl isomerase [Allopseudospirillum japonicum]SEI39301.1 FKBP-type peptidyl-prolyl cis-trans isomerase SlyD [Allopseudospirillum japonicum]
MQISANSVVGIHYTLTDNAGTVLDSSRDRGEPLYYLHGHNNIIPGLENALLGKEAGEALQVTVEPAQAYGERNDALVQEVDKAAFQGVDDIQPGMQFQTQGPGGAMIVTVTDVAAEKVTIDANHPLAGTTLNFDVAIEMVRESTQEEVAHGHPHEGELANH